MRAQVIAATGEVKRGRSFLEMRELPDPVPGRGEVLVRVSACGVCHTELDEIEGRTPPPNLPVVPGHQVVGRVVGVGEGVKTLGEGDRVGVAWIYSACGECPRCERGEENLCSRFTATGRDVNGGYAEYMVVPEAFAHPIPEGFSDVEAAPLLCAGAIGFRSLALTGMKNGQTLGLVGFGASNHLVLKLALYLFPESPIFVFARSEREREFALELGAAWAGDIGENPPSEVDAMIDTTPVWDPIVRSLQFLSPGGRFVINAIRKEEGDKGALLELDYPRHLWLEKEIKSVANVTRSDVRDFLQVAERAGIRPEVETYSLEEAERALLDLKERRIRGAKVLVVG
ncbi:MAG: zinc-binding alcohol dehydrogenase family protein [Deltaproteobacteria bacterium]|nr:MAG: zinc-binding alcohol dehydrogenase family protein [Deltaproteobacteria bacterium]